MAKKYANNLLVQHNPLIKELNDVNKDDEIDYSIYKGYPCEFARDILGVDWWEKQCYIPYLAETEERILVRASHMVGKSYMLSGYCIYVWRTEPVLKGTVISPTLQLTKDVIFSNIRKFMGNDPDVIGTASPTLYNPETPDKILKGISASEAVAIQGRHTDGLALLILDEATGVPAEHWEALESISQGGSGSRWICAYNPIDPSSMVAQLENNADWKVVVISALDHPNVRYYDQNPDDSFIPIPGAITGPYFNSLMRKWSSPIEAKDAKATDIRLPGTNEWVRPSAVGEARLLGRWPTVGYESIWTDSIYLVAENNILSANYKAEIPELGVDVARFGNDHSAIAIKQGGKLIEVDEYYGLSVTELSNLTIQKINEYAYNTGHSAEKIPVKIDANGVGAGVVDILYDAGFNTVEIQVSGKAYEPEKYADIRSELWFNLRDKALDNMISFAGLPTYINNKLRIELLAPIYTMNSKNQIVVEPKLKTKKRTKVTSPNLADAVNLAFYDAGPGLTITVREQTE
ncbi:MAG: hypothetical protein KDH96_00870 [Candidatus Riesia sp.]|nr:hypothetical protein [Candidatus Riesia sp.]